MNGSEIWQQRRELREELTEAIARMRALTQKALDENRSPTEEEKDREYESLDQRQVALPSPIERFNRDIEIQREKYRTETPVWGQVLRARDSRRRGIPGHDR